MLEPLNVGGHLDDPRAEGDGPAGKGKHDSQAGFVLRHCRTLENPNEGSRRKARIVVGRRRNFLVGQVLNRLDHEPHRKEIGLGGPTVSGAEGLDLLDDVGGRKPGKPDIFRSPSPIGQMAEAARELFVGMTVQNQVGCRRMIRREPVRSVGPPVKFGIGEMDAGPRDADGPCRVPGGRRGGENRKRKSPSGEFLSPRGVAREEQNDGPARSTQFATSQWHFSSPAHPERLNRNRRMSAMGREPTPDAVIVIGCRAHLAGFAARRAQKGDRLSLEPYRVAAELPLDAQGKASAETAAIVAEGRSRQDRLAAEGLQSVLRQLGEMGQTPIVAALLVNRAGWITDLLSYSLAWPEHVPVAECLAVRDALRSGIRHCGIEAEEVDEKSLFNVATGRLGLSLAEIELRLKDLGSAVGKPWRKEQKLACLAAWITVDARRR